jgi:hypothetical protein
VPSIKRRESEGLERELRRDGTMRGEGGLYGEGVEKEKQYEMQRLSEMIWRGRRGRI